MEVNSETCVINPQLQPHDHVLCQILEGEVRVGQGSACVEKYCHFICLLFRLVLCGSVVPTLLGDTGHVLMIVKSFTS